MKQSAPDAGLKIIPYTTCQGFGDIISAFDRWETVVLKPRWGAGSAGITILHSKDDLPALATKPEFIRNVHSNQYYLEEYCSGSVYHVDVVYINSGSILISPSRYLVPPLDFEKQNTGSVMLDENGADYSELLRLTKQLIASFNDQTIPNVMHIEFYKNETGDFAFGEMAARRGGGLIKQELAAAYGIDQKQGQLPIGTWSCRCGYEYYAIISVWHTAGNRRIELAKGKRNPGLGGFGICGQEKRYRS